MLLKFSVDNFRGFSGPIELDLTDKKNYQFGKECVRGDFLDKIVIMGANGAGKTNFGYALMDIIQTLTDYSRDIGQIDPICFINGDSGRYTADFSYTFTHKGEYITYQYGKSLPYHVCSEKLIVNNEVVLDYSENDPESLIFRPDLVGADGFEILPLEPDRCVVRRMIENPRFARSTALSVISEFVRNTLYYRAMWKKDEHIGIIDRDVEIDRFICENDLLDQLREFLSEVGCADEHIAMKDGMLVVRTGRRDLPFMKAASRGTAILTRLFCWIKRCTGNEALIYFDDFDDMFHYRTAETAMRRIIASKKTQCIFVTHNTGLITNDFLRPDCCFILESGELSSLASRTDKDIRRGHNLEKMLRDGSFDRSSEE